ncbi:hypothetical protein C8Q78DRAFT_1005851 [Trametes maxima]|nr:hypothetical protein C8Q78DRAFT_1005851 [Trametes maxima]
MTCGRVRGHVCFWPCQQVDKTGMERHPYVPNNTMQPELQTPLLEEFFLALPCPDGMPVTLCCAARGSQVRRGPMCVPSIHPSSRQPASSSPRRTEKPRSVRHRVARERCGPAARLTTLAVSKRLELSETCVLRPTAVTHRHQGAPTLPPGQGPCTYSLRRTRLLRTYKVRGATRSPAPWLADGHCEKARRGANAPALVAHAADAILCGQCCVPEYRAIDPPQRVPERRDFGGSVTWAEG